MYIAVFTSFLGYSFLRRFFLSFFSLFSIHTGDVDAENVLKSAEN